MTSRVTRVEISGLPSLNSARYVCVHAHFLSHSERLMLYSLAGFYDVKCGSDTYSVAAPGCIKFWDNMTLPAVAATVTVVYKN